MKELSFQGKKVAILGFGVNNAELVPFLKERGAQLTICDKRSDLPQSDPDITYQLGDTYLDGLDRFAIIFRTPGIPYLTPELQAAQARGTVITSQTQLFFDTCPAPIIGVTGTKGKGTTSSIITHILTRSHEQGEIPGSISLAGNIGSSPLSLLETLTPNDWVVLELSSFQLHDLTKSPHIAVVLTVTSDHLDHHATVEEYHDAKKNLVRHQTTNDFVVVHHESPVSMGFLDETHAEPYLFSAKQPIHLGAYAHAGAIWLCLPSHEHQRVCDIQDIQLKGTYNLENITAAVITAALAGASLGSIREGVTSFTALPHRLQFVAEKHRRSFYDDSKSTTPDSTIAAFQAFQEPITLILGGSSKGADYSELISALRQSSVKTIICIGQEGKLLQTLFEEAQIPQTILPGETTMSAIVKQAKETTPEGGVVLLSPAAASFDMFKNAEDRGEQFQEAVNQL